MRTILHTSRLLLMVCGLSMVLVGCDVHEWPKPPVVPPPQVPDTVSFSLSIDVDTAWVIWQVVTRAAQHDTRYIVELHHDDGNPNSLGALYQRFVMSTADAVQDGKILLNNIRLPLAAYEAVVWIDLVNPSDTTDLYYNTANLEHIRVIDPVGQETKFDWLKGALVSHILFDLTPLKGIKGAHYEAVAPMKRPLCAYRIITTDVKPFTDLMKVDVTTLSTHVSYHFFVPMGYNTCITMPTDSYDELMYDWQAVFYPGSDDEAIIAAGMFPCEDDTYYTIDFTVHMPNNSVVCTITGQPVPVRRNHITEIRGEFLTKPFGGLGGGTIGIDDKFADEEVIIIN